MAAREFVQASMLPALLGQLIAAWQNGICFSSSASRGIRRLWLQM